MKKIKLAAFVRTLAKPWILVGNPGVKVNGIYENAGAVKKGGVFFCVKGASFDGHDYAAEAVKNGAAAVVAQKEVRGIKCGTALIRVKDTKESLAAAAKNFYGQNKIKTLGITGTKGKTTVSYMADKILTKTTGKKNTVIGTIGYRIGTVKKEAKNTTPSNLEIMKMLYESNRKRIGFAVMEVSSHALVQGRLKNITLERAVVTNITRDHLDFHKTERNYFLAKTMIAGLVKKGGTVCVNADMKKAAEFIKICKKSGVKIITYGIKNKADIKAESIIKGIHGSEFTVKHGNKKQIFKTKLIGTHNIYNVLAAYALTAPYCGIKTAALALSDFKGVPGRLEHVYHGDFSAVVDFAHNPDSIYQALMALRPETKGRLIALFGAGGERDKGKRPLMAKAAERAADIIIVTSDNPRSENPKKIIKEIMKGASKRKKFIVEPDRAKAVKIAVSIAKKGDVIAALGKGPEEYQEIKGIKHPYNDAREILKAVKHGKAGK